MEEQVYLNEPDIEFSEYMWEADEEEEFVDRKICSACFGTGEDRFEFADCIECYGEGIV